MVDLNDLSAIFNLSAKTGIQRKFIMDQANLDRIKELTEKLLNHIITHEEFREFKYLYSMWRVELTGQTFTLM
ncbi:MAG: hypothetical protein HRT37_20930 [Alteromonadaceae bacterium]|nr:hypothetical protein [Alteromonadaceae bacterium]